MSKEETEGSTGKATPADGEMSRPPSVLWLVVPLLLIMVYAAMR